MKRELCKNIHASCVAFEDAGVLLLGKSGIGKSDLALRLIMNKGATLVSDDRVDVYEKEGCFFAAPPEQIAGLLEIRGVGIEKFPHKEGFTKIKLAVELLAKREDAERMPEREFYSFGHASIPLLKLYPFDISAADKIVIKLKAVLD